MTVIAENDSIIYFIRHVCKTQRFLLVQENVRHWRIVVKPKIEFESKSTLALLGRRWMCNLTILWGMAFKKKKKYRLRWQTDITYNKRFYVLTTKQKSRQCRKNVQILFVRYLCVGGYLYKYYLNVSVFMFIHIKVQVCWKTKKCLAVKSPPAN